MPAKILRSASLQSTSNQLILKVDFGAGWQSPALPADEISPG